MAVFLRGLPGGIRIREFGKGKEATQGLPIRDAKAPVRVVVALRQHMGEPNVATAKAGQKVDMGQVIGAAEDLISAPVHAPVSGRVVKLDHCVLPNGLYTPAVVIDNDFQDRWHASCTPRDHVDALDATQLLQIVREAGIVGLSGSAFPTAAKLAPVAESPVDTVILNGMECEPYLTCDHRLMLEASEQIADGLVFAQRMLGAPNAIVGIEDDKLDAAEAMRQAFANIGANVRVEVLPARYARGSERQLIYALTKRTLRQGILPKQVGATMLNVGTAAAISCAVRQGKPLIDRVITLAGRIAEPANLRVRIGTAIADLIDECGGLTEGVEKVVLGGPMMGAALYRLNLPVIKGVNGILAFGKESVLPQARPCIRCGRCHDSCPMGLLPNHIDLVARSNRWDLAQKHNAMACMECGICSYVCPSKRNVAQACATAKAAIRVRQAEKAQKG
ncbi:MAG: electron transport complex subunit RsxC [Clostridia bacterium]|nr:electron transport complex subunit RsxC [Clostridia bacterium]